jgi:hypothetical protein
MYKYSVSVPFHAVYIPIQEHANTMYGEVFPMNTYSGYGLPSQNGRMRAVADSKKNKTAWSKNKKDFDSLKDSPEQVADAWAERIRTAIDQSGMTDLDIAKEVTARGISLSPRTIYNWKMNGGMSRDYIEPFCDVVGCDKLWMLTGSKGEPLQLVHPKASGVEQRHIPVPILETTDLITAVDHAPDDTDDWSREAIISRVDEWMETPTSATEVYVPVLAGHSTADEDMPGTPKYAVQVSQPDHGEEMHGKLMIMALDMWPSRDDFTMWLRRPVAPDGSATAGGSWSLHAGFYRSDAWNVPMDQDARWRDAAMNRLDRYFTLHVRRGETSSDDTVINFSKHQWCYLGTAIFTMGWTGHARTLMQTRLIDRKAAALRRRARRSIVGDEWP